MGKLISATSLTLAIAPAFFGLSQTIQTHTHTETLYPVTRANASKFGITRMWYFKEEFLPTEKTVNQVASNETQT